MNSLLERFVLPIFLVALFSYPVSASVADTDPLDQLNGGEMIDGTFSSITSLAFDHDGVLWIGYRYSGIQAMFDGRFKVFDRMNTDIPNQDISSIYVDRDNNKWFRSVAGHIYRYDNDTWAIVKDVNSIDKRIRPYIKDEDENSLWRFKQPVFTELPLPPKTHEIADTAEWPLSFYEDNFWRGYVETPGNYFWNGVKHLTSDGWKFFTARQIVGETASEFRKLDLLYDKQSDALYLATEYGLFQFLNDTFVQLTKDFNQKQRYDYNVHLLGMDQKNRIWARCIEDWSDRVILYNGDTWIHVHTGTPLEGSRTEALMEDNEGRIWFGGNANGLSMFDGDTWHIFHFARSDTRYWWRTADGFDLFKQRTIHASPENIFQSPRKYRGKKLSLAGSFSSGFEYAKIFDTGGKSLNCWPVFDFRGISPRHLPQALTDTDIWSTPFREFVGYLEFEGNYGHMSGWPYQFLITEEYPYPISPLKRKAIHEAYRNDYIEIENIRDEIRQLVNLWVETMKTGQHSKIRNRIHKESCFFEYYQKADSELNDSSSTFDIEIQDTAISFGGDLTTAKIYIGKARVVPTGESNTQRKGEWRIEGFDFEKEQGIWKFRDIDFVFIPERMLKDYDIERYETVAEKLQRTTGSEYINPLTRP